LLHLVGIISLLSMMHGTTNIKFKNYGEEFFWRSKQFLRYSRNSPHSSEVHCHIHNCTIPVPILSQINPVQVPLPTSLKFILILSSHLHLSLQSVSFLPTKTVYFPLPSHKRATCHAHLILDLITRLIFGEKYRS